MNGKRSAAAVLFAAFACFACTSRVVVDNDFGRSNVGALNINTATVPELEALPGIGRKTAEAIVEHRSANGAFQRAEHVMLVKGLSESRYLEIRPLITK